MSGRTSVVGGRWRARLLPALVIALALAWLAPVTGLTTAPDVRAADTDLTLVTDAVYTVQPERGRVHVTMSVVARNHRGETRTRRFYFTRAYLAVQPGAKNVRVSGAKGAGVRVVKRTKNETLLRIDLGKRLYGGRSETYKLSFDLPDPGGAVDRSLRVGTSLVTLPVWAFASDGARGSRVRVRIPPGFEVAVERGRFDHRSNADGGWTELSTGRLNRPLTFFAFVTAQRTPVYVETPLAVEAGGAPIPLLLRAWEDDPAWGTRTGELLAKALPVLREQVGVAWPATGTTVVEEADSRAAGGYAGLFDPAEHRIEVAWWADPAIVLHEAAHGWFNGALVADRWAAEGFASLYANRAADALGIEAAVPELTDELRAAAVPLNAWAGATAADGDAGGDAGADDDAGGDARRATEAYGFAASLALAEAIADRAGDAGLRNVWAAAAARTGAHQPPATDGAAGSAVPAEVETVTDPPDWRGLLDLLEAETGRDFTDLWRAWVVRPEEAALLDARTATLASYRRALAQADGWALPRSVRDALRAWQFETAEQLLADARTVLAQRESVKDMAAREGIELPDAMRPLFEAGSMAEASAVAEAQRNGMIAIAQAVGERGTDPDPLSQIGMLGEDPEADLADARTALAAGDLDTTLASADDAFRAWNGAWQEGRRRALLGLALAATVVVLLTAVVGRARRRRHEAPVPADPSAVPTPPIAPGGPGGG